MKLTDIDLNDKTEVAAAHALLAAILGNAIAQIAGPSVTLTHVAVAKSDKPSILEPLPSVNLTGPEHQTAAQVFAQPGQLPAGAQPMQDAAAVFGAAPLSGIPVPSSAGAGLPQTAPAGLPATSTALPGMPAPAAQIAPAALVPGGAATVNQGAAPSSPVVGVELDSSGLPWDARIHASTKSKKKDGTWTALRGLNDGGKVKVIEAELRAQVAASQGAQLGAIVQAQSATPLPGTALPTGVAAAPTQALPGAAISGAIPAAADPTTFEQLMPRVTQATIAGVLPPTALQQVCGLLGLPSVVALQQNSAYVPHAWAQLKAAYPALQ